MPKYLALNSLVCFILIVGCGSPATSVKQLDESTAKRMVADRLDTKQYELSINQILPFLVIAHSIVDYRMGDIVPYGPVLKRLLEEGFISQTIHTTSCPEVSGTFVRGCPEADCNLGWFKQQWTLRPIPGTDQLQGEYIFESAIARFAPHSAIATIEADGTFNLSCLDGGCEDTGQGQYYEDGGNGYLRFPQYSRQLNVPYIGPATGRKLKATWYTYALTPKFQGFIQYGPAGPYVLGGNIQVGQVTNLRLNTDTQASANFAWSVSLNDVGKMVSQGNAPNGTGRAVFGKKPDQSWAIDAVTGANAFGQ